MGDNYESGSSQAPLFEFHSADRDSLAVQTSDKYELTISGISGVFCNYKPEKSIILAIALSPELRVETASGAEMEACHHNQCETKGFGVFYGDCKAPIILSLAFPNRLSQNNIGRKFTKCTHCPLSPQT